jgi:hypothetical protein
MNRTRNLLIGAGSALVLAALPLNIGSLITGSPEPSQVYAKSDNGGGNGNGGGRGNGNGGGSGGQHGESGDGGGKGHGKSGQIGQRGKSGGSGLSAPGRLKAIASQDTHGGKGKSKAAKSSHTGLAKSNRKSSRAVELAALPEEAPIPTIKPDKNLNARLAGLNSLKRNYHAYLNSQSPRMTSIRDFVMASANLDIANENLAAAQAEFDAELAEAELTPFDDPLDRAGIYDDPSLTDLEDRLADLEAVDPASLTPAEQAALEAERTALESLLDSEEATNLAQAEDAAEAATVGTDDKALRQALMDAANKNRIAQYGDDYVNDDVMNWAKDVLGVGEDFGKIDEVRETLLIDQQ